MNLELCSIHAEINKYFYAILKDEHSNENITVWEDHNKEKQLYQIRFENDALSLYKYHGNDFELEAKNMSGRQIITYIKVDSGIMEGSIEKNGNYITLNGACSTSILSSTDKPRDPTNTFTRNSYEYEYSKNDGVDQFLDKIKKQKEAVEAHVSKPIVRKRTMDDFDDIDFDD